MSPNGPDEQTALSMLPLLERGRAALLAHLRTIPKSQRPIGAGQVHVVTRADFVANPDLCLNHVELNGTPTHVLCPSGALCILVEQRHHAW